jgi:hypothetical protein
MARTLLAILSIVPICASCAFTDVPLTLPERGLEKSLTGGDGRQVTVVVPFSDERAIRDRCGMQKNGYNMDTADVVCQSDPNEWIAQLLADELGRSGFTVLKEGAERRPGALQVRGSLIKIFVEPVIGAWTGSLEADLSVRLHVATDTGLKAERTFFVKGWKGGQLASTSRPFHTALHRSSQAIVAEMVRAIVELMDRYPQLGLWRTPLQTVARLTRATQ